MKKLLFLDIDEVLNCITQDVVQHRGHPTECITEAKLNVYAVGILNRICKEFDFEVVISSTWRLFSGYHTNGHDNSHIDKWNALFTLSINQLSSLTGSYIANHIKVIDTTDDLPGIRGDEINAYLESIGEEVQYVILDDGSDFYDYQNLIKCDPFVGLSCHNYTDIVVCMNEGLFTNYLPKD